MTGGGDRSQIRSIASARLRPRQGHHDEEGGAADADERATHSFFSSSGSEMGVTGSAGKSSSMRSPSNEAVSGPLRVMNVSGRVPSTTPRSRMAWAEASVA